MYIKLRLLCICFLLCFMSSSCAAEDKPSVMSEIQILIDVSGSMKQNDPKNLRISALKLLVNLLPRFYSDYEGVITLDGHDSHDLTLISLRRQISLVSQGQSDHNMGGIRLYSLDPVAGEGFVHKPSPRYQSK